VIAADLLDVNRSLGRDQHQPLQPAAHETDSAPKGMTAAEMADLAGTYSQSTRTMSIVQRDGRLFLARSNGETALEKVGANRFRAGDSRFVTVADAAGKVEYIHTGGRSWRKVSEKPPWSCCGGSWVGGGYGLPMTTGGNSPRAPTGWAGTHVCSLLLEELAIVLPRDVYGHRSARATERTARAAVDQEREGRRVADSDHGFVTHFDRLPLASLHEAIRDARAVDCRGQPAGALRTHLDAQEFLVRGGRPVGVT
jgi:hypothetical protein